MMNNCFPPTKYDKEYWMSFEEMLSAFIYPYTSTPEEYHKDLDNMAIDSFMKDIKWMNTSNEYNIGSFLTRYSPWLFTWDSQNSIYYINDYARPLFFFLQQRFRKEYVFPMSFDYGVLKNFNDFGNWTSEQKEEYYEKAREFITKLCSIIHQTCDRYLLLLDTYDEQRDNLLNKVEAITRFNDTPQNSGEFSDDEHTTHITTSKNDYDTLMARIDEIDRNYRNLLKDWSNEFECLFFHEESL